MVDLKEEDFREWCKKKANDVAGGPAMSPIIKWLEETYGDNIPSPEGWPEWMSKFLEDWWTQPQNAWNWSTSGNECLEILDDQPQ